MYRPHPSNDGQFRPTPRYSNTRSPSGGELASYQTGPDRFPDLDYCGSFQTWPLDNLFPNVILDARNFNCFAWSLGHADRWIEGGTVQDMNALYTLYHFEQCSPALAEVELYRILDAPPTLTSRRGNEYPNLQALVKHAHRRDRLALDQRPGLGCSSKLREGPLILHNRRALEDIRNYGSQNPAISYGSIYQHWRRGPEHPASPEKRANLVPATGNHPADSMFELGHGRRPPGHPGNSEGLPGFKNEWNSGARQSGSGRDRHGTHDSRTRTSTSYQPSPGYARVTRMRAYEPIPPPNRAAKEAAARACGKVRESVVERFDRRFDRWESCWYSSTGGRMSSAKARCSVDEFDHLLDMGPEILPLVVDKLCDPGNFTGVFLYNALERDTKYRIDPHDVLNYLVLQRQNNLIIDINERRRW